LKSRFHLETTESVIERDNFVVTRSVNCYLQPYRTELVL